MFIFIFFWVVFLLRVLTIFTTQSHQSLRIEHLGNISQFLHVSLMFLFHGFHIILITIFWIKSTATHINALIITTRIFLTFLLHNFSTCFHTIHITQFKWITSKFLSTRITNSIRLLIILLLIFLFWGRSNTENLCEGYFG